MTEEAKQAKKQSDASALPGRGSPESPSVLPPAQTPQGSPESSDINWGDFDWNDLAKTALMTGVKFVPYVGSILGAFVSILWPSSQEDIWEEIRERVEKLIDKKIAERTYNQVKNALIGLHNNIIEYQHALQYSQGNPTVISENWTTVHNLFVNDLPDFQDPGYEILLLPLFAQFANLHLSLLRDGALFGSQWGWTQEYVASIQEELSRTIQDYRAYAENVYEMGGMVAPPVDNRRCEPFLSMNKYLREMTESVLDYRNTWQYLDPSLYPNPVTISFDRELFSDPCGSCVDSGTLDLSSSTPPTGRMEQVTVWGWDRIDAIQVDYPPGQGPDGITSTGRMGNDDGGVSTPPAGGVFDTRNASLKAVWVDYGDIVNALWFWVDGEDDYRPMMGGKAGIGSEKYEFKVPDDCYLSRIHINGVSFYYGTADCIVLGYKYAPSAQSMRQAVRRLYVHTPGDRSFPELVAQYASKLEMTPEELSAQASEERWEQERQQYWQSLREQVQRSQAER